MLKLQYSVYINLNARFEWVKIHTKDLEQVKQTQHVPNVHIYISLSFSSLILCQYLICTHKR